jgi:DNA-3-methyladenine glycosylase II
MPKRNATSRTAVERIPVETGRLTREHFAHGLDELARRDRHLAGVLAAIGPPPMWARKPGFGTLLHIILEQQVSLASAQAAFDRLKVACHGRITPRHILILTDEQLKRIGFSRQKAGYARELSRAILLRQFNPAALEMMPDEAVREALVALKGIGPWTADIYLLMVLLRPDVWPHGDLALAVAVQEIMGLSTRPTYVELSQMAERWKPWRAVAARICWHYYLNQKD